MIINDDIRMMIINDDKTAKYRCFGWGQIDRTAVNVNGSKVGHI